MLDNVVDFTLIITQYRPLTGSTFISTPRRIVRKQSVVNVRNSDNRCFQWAILSCLYPPKSNPHNVYSYTKYVNTLNFDDISFPVSVKDISKFEKQNPDFTLISTQYCPLTGSTFISTPRRIVRKQAVVNVRNSDNRCFQWAILSCLYPPKSNPHNVYSYTKYVDTLNFDDISFPVSVKDISKFEKQNPDISVNVISLDQNDKDFCVEYLSPNANANNM